MEKTNLYAIKKTVVKNVCPNTDCKKFFNNFVKGTMSANTTVYHPTRESQGIVEALFKHKKAFAKTEIEGEFWTLKKIGNWFVLKTQLGYSIEPFNTEFTFWKG